MAPRTMQEPSDSATNNDLCFTRRESEGRGRQSGLDVGEGIAFMSVQNVY